MKITSKTLMINIENDVKVGNGAIEATLVHQAFVYESKDGSIGVDIDFIDTINVKFMGVPIEKGYAGYKKFRDSMKELGIDIDDLFDKESHKSITDEDIEYLKSLGKIQMA